MRAGHEDTREMEGDEVMLTRLQAKARGVLDGLQQPYDLTMGLTWPDDGDANEAYDRGVNVGQALARAGLRIGDTFTVLRLGGRVEPAEAP